MISMSETTEAKAMSETTEAKARWRGALRVMKALGELQQGSDPEVSHAATLAAMAMINVHVKYVAFLADKAFAQMEASEKKDE